MQLEFTVVGGGEVNFDAVTSMPLFEVELIGECLGGPCAEKTRSIGRGTELRECSAQEMESTMLKPPALFTNSER